MKLIIPMAGMGKRLRPHTLHIPKPLLKIAGKHIVEWIIDYFHSSINKEITEVHFVTGKFGSEVEKKLISLAEKIGAKGFIHYQEEALGTAHAIYCAKEGLNGNVLIAFADTLFQGKFEIDDSDESIMWCMKVSNPENYGVVKTDRDNIITEFVEKPKEFVSDNALIGIYYFAQGELLRDEIQGLIENDLKENNEYQLTNCLETLKQKGLKIKCKNIEEWLDCGNRNELLKTNRRLIQLTNYEYEGSKNKISELANIQNSSIEDMCYIEDNTRIVNSKLKNCIIYENTVIENCEFEDSIIGANSKIIGLKGKVDFSEKTRYESI